MPILKNLCLPPFQPAPTTPMATAVAKLVERLEEQKCA